MKLLLSKLFAGKNLEINSLNVKTKKSAKSLNNTSIFSNNFNKSRSIIIQNSESITWKKSRVEKFRRLK